MIQVPLIDLMVMVILVVLTRGFAASLEFFTIGSAADFKDISSFLLLKFEGGQCEVLGRSTHVLMLGDTNSKQESVAAIDMTPSRTVGFGVSPQPCAVGSANAVLPLPQSNVSEGSHRGYSPLSLV